MNAGVLEDTLLAMYSKDVREVARNLGLGRRRAKRELIPLIMDLHAVPSCAILVRDAVDAIQRRKHTTCKPPAAQQNLLPAFDAVADPPGAERMDLDLDSTDDVPSGASEWTSSESDDDPTSPATATAAADGAVVVPGSPAMIYFADRLTSPPSKPVNSCNMLT